MFGVVFSLCFLKLFEFCHFANIEIKLHMMIVYTLYTIIIMLGVREKTTTPQ